MEKFPTPEQNKDVLTAELARESPEIYKQKLIDKLRSETFLSGEIWDALTEEGVIDEKSLVLDEKTWISGSDSEMRNDGTKRAIVKLGIAPQTKEQSESLIYQDQDFKGDKNILYRLSHELCHQVLFTQANKEDGALVGLLNGVNKIRKAQNKGFSPLGTLPFYEQRGSETQAKEDLTELINMYVLKEGYLESFLGFLQAKQYSSDRAVLGLAAISSQSKENLLSNVSNGVESFLKDRSWSKDFKRRV